MTISECRDTLDSWQGTLIYNCWQSSFFTPYARWSFPPWWRYLSRAIHCHNCDNPSSLCTVLKWIAAKTTLVRLNCKHDFFPLPEHWENWREAPAQVTPGSFLKLCTAYCLLQCTSCQCHVRKTELTWASPNRNAQQENVTLWPASHENSLHMKFESNSSCKEIQSCHSWMFLPSDDCPPEQCQDLLTASAFSLTDRCVSAVCPGEGKQRGRPLDHRGLWQGHKAQEAQPQVENPIFGVCVCRRQMEANAQWPTVFLIWKRLEQSRPVFGWSMINEKPDCGEGCGCSVHSSTSDSLIGSFTSHPFIHWLMLQSCLCAHHILRDKAGSKRPKHVNTISPLHDKNLKESTKGLSSGGPFCFVSLSCTLAEVWVLRIYLSFIPHSLEVSKCHPKHHFKKKNDNDNNIQHLRNAFYVKQCSKHFK